MPELNYVVYLKKKLLCTYRCMHHTIIIPDLRGYCTYEFFKLKRPLTMHGKELIGARFILLLVVTTTIFSDSDSTFHPDLSQWEFAADMSTASRPITSKILSVEQAEGVGARVRRSVGRPEVS